MSGTLWWHMLLLVFALSSTLSEAAPVPDSLTVLVNSPISVTRGHKTTLPCWLNPPQSAEALEVRWYRSDHFDSPVLLYQGKKIDDSSQDIRYIGRVSFGLKDVVSGGLKAGDVSLNLEDVVLEDGGEYTCYVSSDQGYDSASVTLSVTQTGASPLVSAVLREDNKVNVSCESEGWYPEPTLSWSDPKKVLPSENTKTSKKSSGLLSVHSWILVSSSTEVSCSVGLSGAEAKVARVRLDITPQTASGSAVGGWVAFTLLLIAVLVLLGVLYYKYKEILVNLPTHLSTAKKNYVDVTLCRTENPYLTIKDDIVRDAHRNDFPEGTDVTCLTAIRGEQGFTSGKHYWEVSLGNDAVGIKKSWWLGVTSVKKIAKENVSAPSNGFWFLSSTPDDDDKRFHFNTEPELSLSVFCRPRTVGVYLNYNSGELSFYNVDNESLIGTLKVKFKGKVFPLFNPGKGDRAPITILRKEDPKVNSDQGANKDGDQRPNKDGDQGTNKDGDQRPNKDGDQGTNKDGDQGTNKDGDQGAKENSEKEPNSDGNQVGDPLLRSPVSHKNDLSQSQ